MQIIKTAIVDKYKFITSDAYLAITNLLGEELVVLSYEDSAKLVDYLFKEYEPKYTKQDRIVDAPKQDVKEYDAWKKEAVLAQQGDSAGQGTASRGVAGDAVLGERRSDYLKKLEEGKYRATGIDVSDISGPKVQAFDLAKGTSIKVPA